LQKQDEEFDRLSLAFDSLMDLRPIPIRLTQGPLRALVDLIPEREQSKLLAVCKLNLKSNLFREYLCKHFILFA